MYSEENVALRVMLENYKNGNKWLSGRDVREGFEVKRDGVVYVFYPQLSRRLSDLNIKLPSGRKLAFDKFNRYQDTPYTAYRIRTILRAVDLIYLDELTK
jgi:hypothetical protein